MGDKVTAEFTVRDKPRMETVYRKMNETDDAMLGRLCVQIAKAIARG